jgi:hypothetical protein
MGSEREILGPKENCGEEFMLLQLNKKIQTFE